MQTASYYRTSAEECKRLAGNAPSPEQRTFLLELAATWVSLAERNERVEQVGLKAVESALA
jgi:hypothetical protein